MSFQESVIYVLGYTHTELIKMQDSRDSKAFIVTCTATQTLKTVECAYYKSQLEYEINVYNFF